MSYGIREAIEEQATRTIRKHNHAISSRRYGQRGKTGTVNNGTISRWGIERQFNPFYVRSKVDSISHAIELAIRNESYEPRPALNQRIPKRGGGHRCITISTVPDAAVGSWLNKRLFTRNRKFLSDFAFGYRPDKNSDQAISFIASAVASTPRPSVVEYDFENFFDSIDHTYLLEVLNNHFQVRRDEMSVLFALLKGRSASESDYRRGIFTGRRIGIPQGNSISLFLANAVCFELDESLENHGITFARYGDDIVAIGKTHSEADQAADLILRWSRKARIEINYKKSQAISLLTEHDLGEIKHKPSITFLGCDIGGSGIRPSEKRVERIKTRIARVIYEHLISTAKQGASNIQSGIDWDLVECVNEIRRIVYGRLTEKNIADALSGKRRPKRMRSHMSGFAMVDIPDAFKQLDGCIVGQIERAYAQRAALTSRFNVKPLNRVSIISGAWCDPVAIKSDTRLPSTFRAWLYQRRSRAKILKHRTLSTRFGSFWRLLFSVFNVHLRARFLRRPFRPGL